MVWILLLGCPDDKPLTRGDCEDYLECLADVEPDAVASAVSAYGEDGTCWTGDDDQAETCRDACTNALDALADAFPESDACGGSSVSESDSDTDPGSDTDTDNEPDNPAQAAVFEEGAWTLELVEVTRFECPAANDAGFTDDEYVGSVAGTTSAVARYGSGSTFTWTMGYEADATCDLDGDSFDCRGSYDGPLMEGTLVEEVRWTGTFTSQTSAFGEWEVDWEVTAGGETLDCSWRADLDAFRP